MAGRLRPHEPMEDTSDMTTTASPLLAKGERLTADLAEAIHSLASEGQEVLIRTAGEWNTASSALASTKAAKIMAPYVDDLRLFCRRIDSRAIGLYAVADSV